MAEYLGTLRLSKVVRWTSEEWDNLASRVHKKRARHPELTLWQLANAVQAQQDWPKDRKRRVQGSKSAQPLITRLRKLDMELFAEVAQHQEEMGRLEDTVETLKKRPTRDAALASLTEEEIVRRFAPVVFQEFSPAEIIKHFTSREILISIPLPEVFAFVGESLVGGLQAVELRLANHLNEHRPIPIMNGAPKTNGVAKKVAIPRIAVFGFQQHHITQLKAHIGHKAAVLYVPKGETKNRMAIPDCEHAIVWEINISAANKKQVRISMHDRLTVHSGTFNELLEKLHQIPCLAAKGKG